jgi:hypothetical protein
VKKLFHFSTQGRVASACPFKDHYPRLGTAFQGLLKDSLNRLPPLYIHFSCPALFVGAAKELEAPVVMEDDVRMILTWLRSEMRAELVSGVWAKFFPTGSRSTDFIIRSPLPDRLYFGPTDFISCD